MQAPGNEATEVAACVDVAALHKEDRKPLPDVTHLGPAIASPGPDIERKSSGMLRRRVRGAPLAPARRNLMTSSGQRVERLRRFLESLGARRCTGRESNTVRLRRSS